MGVLSNGIKAFKLKTIKASEEEAQKVAEDVIKSLIDKSPHPEGAINPSRNSPWADGVFVNNWYVGDSVSSNYTDAPITSKDAKKSELTGLIKGWFDNNKSLYIYTTSPYAQKVEYQGWANGNTPAYYPILNTVQEIGGKYR